MDALFGVATKDYVVLASDTFFRNSVVVAKTDHKRCTKISERAAVITSGQQGDCDRTIRRILESLKYEESTGCLAVTEQTFSSCLQRYMHEGLRKNPVEVTSIIGGMSNGYGQLFYIDKYGAEISGNYFSVGYASYLFLSAMDMHYRPDMPKDEAVNTIKETYENIKKKLIVSYGSLHICTITREEGVQEYTIDG